MHLVLNVFIFTRLLVTYARTIIKPRRCLNFQSMRTQAESTDIAHKMFGQIKMKKPWYNNWHIYWWPKDLSKHQRDIHLVEIKYWEDTRPQNQLNAAKEQHKDHCNILQVRSLYLLLSTSSFWVWAAPSTTPTLWSNIKNRVSILKELRSLPPSSMCTLWTLLLKLSIPDRRALSSTVINSHQESVSGQACNPPDPHWFFHSFSVVEELYGTRYQSGSFSLINVGSGFHCLRSFSFLLHF